MPDPCPHLGLRKDAASVLQFPSRDNACHRVDPPGMVRPAYQHQTCLTAGHRACPVFTAAVPPDALPPEIAAEPQLNLRLPSSMPWWVLPLVAFALVAAAIFTPLGNALAGLSRSMGGAVQTPLVRATRTPMPTETLLFRFTPSPRSQVGGVCPPPSAWVEYVVKPTDSLLRLSIVYNLTVLQLQEANCLGEETIIRPGQRLWVPFQPSATPTITRTPTILVWSPVPTRGGGGSSRTRTPTPTRTVTATLQPTFTRTLAPTFTATVPSVTPSPPPPPTFTPSATSPPEDSVLPPGLINTLLPPFPTTAP